MEEDPNASQVLEVAPPALTAVGRNARNGLSDDADLRFFHDRLGIGSAMHSSDTLMSAYFMLLLNKEYKDNPSKV